MLIRKLLSLMLLIFFIVPPIALSEEPEETILYVVADGLNGRSKPSTKATIEAYWENGGELYPTGRWSKNHEWIEVEGAETPTVWVHIGYFSEQLTSYIAYNRDYDKVKIRSRPIDGRVKGYLKKGQEIEIQQVVLGWGKTPQGWIDLYYLEERNEEP